MTYRTHRQYFAILSPLSVPDPSKAARSCPNWVSAAPAWVFYDCFRSSSLPNLFSNLLGQLFLDYCLYSLFVLRVWEITLRVDKRWIRRNPKLLRKRFSVFSIAAFFPKSLWFHNVCFQTFRQSNLPHCGVPESFSQVVIHYSHSWHYFTISDRWFFLWHFIS